MNDCAIRQSGAPAHGGPGGRRCRTDVDRLPPSRPCRSPGRLSSDRSSCQQSLVPKRSTVQRPAYQPVIDDVERGIASGSVADFSTHFPSQVSISLRGEGSGTYSSNQAYYLLDQFFRLRRFTGCKLSTVGESGGIPFATGSASFTLKGGRENGAGLSLPHAQRRPLGHLADQHLLIRP